MLEFRYDTQLLIEGENLDEDAINDYFVEHFKGDCLLAVGDEELIKIHFHTNEPWKVLEYCSTLGDCLVFKEHFCFRNSLELTLNIISYVFSFVNNFFKLFYFVCFAVSKTLYFVCCSSATLIIIYHIHKTCQQLF